MTTSPDHEPAAGASEGPQPAPIEEWVAAHWGGSPDLLAILDAEGGLRHANNAARRRLVGAGKDLDGRAIFDFVPAADREELRRSFQGWVRSEETPSRTFEMRLLDAEGTTRSYRWTVTRHRGEDGQPVLVASAHDITTIRHEGEQLALSEERFRALLTGIHEPVLTVDAHGIIRGANDSVEGVFGYRPEDLEGANLKLLLGDPHRAAHDDYLERYRRTGKAMVLEGTREMALRHRDGHELYCELSVSRVDVPGEDEPLFVSVFRNVTERREAARRLVESERRFRAVFDQENRYVCLLEPDGRVIEANPMSLEVMHLSADDVVGRLFWETEWFSRSAGASERVHAAVEQAAAGEFVRLELNLPAAGEGFRTVDITIKPIRDDAGEVTMLLPEGRDVTDLRLAKDRETSMLKALATIGESAAILAHEIKNPITAIHYALSAVATELGEDQKAIIDDLVDRLKLLEKMMRRTLSFTRPLEFRPTVCALGPLLEQVVSDLAPLARSKDVGIELELDDAEAQITADPQLIGEVFANLVSNALDAMEEAGHIRIQVEFDEPGFLLIHVADDGPGVPPSLLDSLFKPFFTTKSSGTGLGLALCRKILEEHGGSIELCSTSMGGACFRVTLPSAG